MSDERVFLTTEQALSMLPDGDNIHTFRSGGFALLGCDMSRDEIIKIITSSNPELSGDMASAMNHKMVVNFNGWLFIETKEKE